jgi:arginase family enzyme
MPSIFDPQVYAPAATFMGAPNGYDLARAKAAILGVPFDCRTHPVRIGARLGPAAIREQSALVRPYQPPLWNPKCRQFDERRSAIAYEIASIPFYAIGALPGAAASRVKSSRLPAK